MRLSVSISAICNLFVSFSTTYALIPCLGFLIVRVINFLQAFEENSPFAAYKTAQHESWKKLERNFKILQLVFTSSAIILSTCHVGRYEVKNRARWVHVLCCQSVTRVNLIIIELQCSTYRTSEIRMVMGGENVFKCKGARFQGFGECFPWIVLNLEVVKYHFERSYIDNYVSNNSKLQHSPPPQATQAFDKIPFPAAKNWALRFPGVWEL